MSGKHVIEKRLAKLEIDYMWRLLMIVEWYFAEKERITSLLSEGGA